MIDAHCHLNATHTPETVLPVIDRFISYGGKAIVDVATELKDISSLAALIEKFPRMIFATIGVHPENCNVTREIDPVTELAKCLTQAASLKNLVALGETGLDYGSLPEEQAMQKQAIEKQRELLTAHIAAAQHMSLPLVIHARGRSNEDYSPYTDVLSVLKQEKFSGKVYFHSFGGDTKCAQQILDQGYVLGVNGISTYSSAKIIAETCSYAPLSSLLLETDSPFLIPSNMDRTLLQSPKTNEPVSIWFTAKRLAAVKHIQPEEVLEATERNARVFFAKI